MTWYYPWGGVGQLFLGGSQSRIYPNMCAQFGCGLTVVSKKGGYRQTDKQRDTAALYNTWNYYLLNLHYLLQSYFMFIFLHHKDQCENLEILDYMEVDILMYWYRPVVDVGLNMSANWWSLKHGSKTLSSCYIYKRWPLHREIDLCTMYKLC